MSHCPIRQSITGSRATKLLSPTDMRAPPSVATRSRADVPRTTFFRSAICALDFDRARPRRRTSSSRPSADSRISRVTLRSDPVCLRHLVVVDAGVADHTARGRALRDSRAGAPIATPGRGAPIQNTTGVAVERQRRKGDEPQPIALYSAPSAASFRPDDDAGSPRRAPAPAARTGRLRSARSSAPRRCTKRPGAHRSAPRRR